MKYVDASAVLRVVFQEPGETVPLGGGDVLVSSGLIEVEALRAVDRLRLLGAMDDSLTARKRSELQGLLARIDLVAIDGPVLARARSPFAVNVRALDAIHVATAELLAEAAHGEPIEFWTHDERQGTAALSRGLAVRGLDR